MTSSDSTYSGEVCHVDQQQNACFEPADGFMCSLPAESPNEATNLLEVIGSGGALGTGLQLSRLGVQIPEIRTAYEQAITRLASEVEKRRRAGDPAESIARYAVEERRRIATKARQRSGPGTRMLFTIRDWGEYGPGGRTYRNIERRYLQRGFRGAELHQRLVKGATSPNTGITNTALRAARFLRHGGRVLVVISVPTTAYVILTAPRDQLARILAEEAGGFVGGALGSSAGAGICLVFGIATGGWGLLACGIVGGLAGGAGGAWTGNRLYVSDRVDIEHQVRDTGVVEVSELKTMIPAPMCVAPLTR